MTTCQLTALRSCYCPLWVSPSRLAVDHRHETSRLPLAKRIYSAPYGRTDDVEVKVIFDEKARKEANVELESTSRTYQVRGLEETPEQKAERVEIIDGHEVPRDWELEDEDKKAYIEYLKQLENAEDELVEEKGAYTEWMKGNSKEETKKENKEFLTKDYANNSTVAFKRANEYGLTSSQEFKVQPIIKKDKTIGYECIFKGSE